MNTEIFSPPLSLPPLSEKLASFLARAILDTEPPPAPPPEKQREKAKDTDTEARLSAYLSKARRRALLFTRSDLVLCMTLCCPRCHQRVYVHPTRPHAWLCVPCRYELGEAAWQDTDGQDDEGGPVTLQDGVLRAGNGQPLHWATVPTAWAGPTKKEMDTDDHD